MKSIRTPLLLIIILILAILLFLQYQKNQTLAISYNLDSARVHHITLEDAVQLTSNFRAGRRNLMLQLKDSSYLNKSFNLSFAEKINRDAVAELLNVNGAAGIRIYFGKSFPKTSLDTARIRIILVAVDSRGKDILPDYPKQGRLKSAKASYVMYFQGNDVPPIDDKTQHCPEMCDLSSPLYQPQ